MPKINWRPERNALAAILENPGVPPTIADFGAELLRSIDSLAGSYETFYPSINDAGRTAAESKYAADLAAWESDAADSFDSAATAVHKAALPALVQELPPRYRKVIERQLAGESIERIAIEMGREVRSVRTYASHALARLRAMAAEPNI